MRTNRRNKYEVEDRLTVVETIQAFVVGLFIFILIGACGYVESHYNRQDCTVTVVRENYAVAEDTLGYTWSWYITDADDVMVGDKVTLHMFTAHTDNTIDDDEVVGVMVQQ